MNALRKLTLLLSLTLACTTSTAAGEIHTGVTSPPSAPQGQITTTTLTEESLLDVSALGPLSGVGLTLLRNVLALF